MKKLDIEVPSNAAAFELDNGDVYRVHIILVTPEAQLATADHLDILVRGYKIDKHGAFIVDDNDEPILLKEQRMKVPLANVKQGLDSVKPGWVEVALPTDEAQRDEVLGSAERKLKKLPATGEAGQTVAVDDKLYRFTDGIYDQIRRQVISQTVAAAEAASAPEAMDANFVASLRP